MTATPERALVGALLLDPAAAAKVAPLVSAADFDDAPLGVLFDTLATLAAAGKPVHDGRWLAGELPRHRVAPDLCSVAALARLAEEAGFARYAADYAEQVAAAAALRRLGTLAVDLRTRAADAAADPAEVRAWLEGQLARLDRGRGAGSEPVDVIAAEVLADLEREAAAERHAGVFTGILSADNLVGPMMPGEMVVVAARPGAGKTAFAAQVALHNTDRGRRVWLASLEMSRSELVRRVLCGDAGVDSRDARAGRLDAQDIERLRQASASLSSRFLVWAPTSATLADIRAEARYVAAAHGLDLIVVDYIGRIAVAGDDRRLQRWEQVTRISSGLKTLARELSVPLIALCQLNRDADSGEPMLSHLRESGAIEQDADMVFMLHHAERPQNSECSECSLIVAKHRHGATGKLPLRWYPAETRFECPGLFRF